MKLQQVAPQQDSRFGTSLLAGQPTLASSDDLFVGTPGWDSLIGTNVGRWDRWTWSNRQPVHAGSHSGQGSQWFVGTTLALAFSSDGTGRVLSGDPGADVGGESGAGRVSVLWDSATSGPHLYQDSPVVLEAPEANDQFGAVIVVGDFNGDTYDDIAISAPSEDEELTRRAQTETPPPVHADRGVVHIYYGAANDLDFQTGEVLTSPLWETESTYFGIALAVGDFNGDGYDDLAVGEPLARADNVSLAGAVHVFFGSFAGIQIGTPQTLTPSQLGLSAHVGLEFGRGLAAADFNRNILCAVNNACRDDLAIGAPGFFELDARGVPGPGGEQMEGAVVVATGTSTGLSGTMASVIQQDDLEANLRFKPNSLDRFGERLWAGNFDGLMGGDLAIGVPRDGVFAKYGVLHLVYGGSSGLQSRPGHLLHWGNITGEPRQVEDRFGTSFAAGDFDGDGAIDFAIGAPGIDVGPATEAGQLLVLFGGCMFCDGFESGSTNGWQ